MDGNQAFALGVQDVQPEQLSNYPDTAGTAI